MHPDTPRIASQKNQQTCSSFLLSNLLRFASSEASACKARLQKFRISRDVQVLQLTPKESVILRSNRSEAWQPKPWLP